MLRVHEIKGIEKEVKKVREENYKKIKPEKEWTKQEVDDFWNDVFGMN